MSRRLHTEQTDSRAALAVNARSTAPRTRHAPDWSLLCCQAGQGRSAREGASGRLGAGGGEDAEQASGEVALEGAERFAVGLALADAPGVVVACGGVDADLGDGDDVQRAVEAAVAGAVEAVALLASGAGVER